MKNEYLVYLLRRSIALTLLVVALTLIITLISRSPQLPPGVDAEATLEIKEAWIEVYPYGGTVSLANFGSTKDTIGSPKDGDKLGWENGNMFELNKDEYLKAKKGGVAVFHHYVSHHPSESGWKFEGIK